jgi:dTDP-4-dehydrorhamnose 3,5-epimerase
VLYQMGNPYVPEAGRGVRWDDPAFAIDWPAPPPAGLTISERDASYPDFEA